MWRGGSKRILWPTAVLVDAAVKAVADVGYHSNEHAEHTAVARTGCLPVPATPPTTWPREERREELGSW
eukprot:m.226539 g.226539  ORF g.226539 m.226539 type:complete len:69 (-) comp18800_c0_seq1:1126-1332(-)